MNTFQFQWKWIKNKAKWSNSGLWSSSRRCVLVQHTDRQADGQTDRYIYGHRNRQTDIQTDRKTDSQGALALTHVEACSFTFLLFHPLYLYFVQNCHHHREASSIFILWLRWVASLFLHLTITLNGPSQMHTDIEDRDASTWCMRTAATSTKIHHFPFGKWQVIKVMKPKSFISLINF